LDLDTIWPRLIAAADEMAMTLFRTAFSHDVVEVHDMSTGLYDDRGNLIGQTWLGATGHVGVMPVVGKQLVKTFPPEVTRPGDVFICNDPWVCNGQTADIFIFTPAFHRDRLIGYSVNSVHHVDIGGRRGSGLSEEVFEEGLIIPLMRLHRAGQPNEDLLAILTRNVRFSEKVMGDIRAQLAAGWVGAEELARIARDHRLEDLHAVADEIIGRSEQAMRAGIASLPRGTFTKSIPVEIGGVDEPARIQLSLTIESDHIAADFAGTSAQVRRPVNSPINYTRAYVAVPLKMICDSAAEQRGDLPPTRDQRTRRHAYQSELSGGLFLAVGVRHAGIGAGVSHFGRHRAGARARRFRIDADLAVLCEWPAPQRRSMGIAPARIRRHGRASRS